MGSGETGMGSERRPPLCSAGYHPPERSVQENHIDPTHHCVRCHSQLVDGKRNLVGPQDKLPIDGRGPEW